MQDFGDERYFWSLISLKFVENIARMECFSQKFTIFAEPIGAFVCNRWPKSVFHITNVVGEIAKSNPTHYKRFWE